MYRSKIAEFIAKDTSGQNESKKLIIVLRILIVSLWFYFLINLILAAAFAGTKEALPFAVPLILYAGLFAMSYRFRTGQVLFSFHCATIVWIWYLVWCMGWNIGVQQFLLLLLVLNFFSSYKNYGKKIATAFLLCAIRILIYYLYSTSVPLWEPYLWTQHLLQIINTVTIYWCISVIAFVFSNDSQELESKLVEYNDQLEEQANTDTLTKLYNRRWAGERLSRMVNEKEQYGDFSICICDIDFFKKVNDNYGHDFGDEVLRCLAVLLKKDMTGDGFAARWGGEEFLLVFTGCNGDDAYIKLEQIQKDVRAMKVVKDGLTVSITMTFGLAEFDFINGLEKTVKEADQKLYMGKEKGRDVIIY